MTDCTTRQIPLTQGQFALVDAEDYDRVMCYKWMAMRHRSTYYAMRSIRIDSKKAVVMMHRFILNITDPFVKVDHEDMDGLNNTRDNIRIATVSNNNCNKKKQRNNTSGYKGVWWHKKHQKWYAAIRKDRKAIFLGLYTDAADAARAYDVAALIYHGEFALLNFKPESPSLAVDP
jgi:hypothetical protein